MIVITISGPSEKDRSLLVHNIYAFLKQHHYFGSRKISMPGIGKPDTSGSGIHVTPFRWDDYGNYCVKIAEKESEVFLAPLKFTGVFKEGGLSKAVYDALTLNQPLPRAVLPAANSWIDARRRILTNPVLPAADSWSKVKNFTPENWPADAPPYDSAEGWEYEKAAKLRRLKAQVTASWFANQGTPRHLLIANRLKEIL